jgi:hypothetical protein
MTHQTMLTLSEAVKLLQQTSRLRETNPHTHVPSCDVLHAVTVGATTQSTHLGHDEAGLAHLLLHVLWHDWLRRQIPLAPRGQMRHGIPEAHTLPVRPVYVRVVRCARKWLGRLPLHLIRARLPLADLPQVHRHRDSPPHDLKYTWPFEIVDIDDTALGFHQVPSGKFMNPNTRI